MNPALDQRSPVAKAGWLVGLFLLGWLAFLFIPWPWRTPPPEPMPRMVVHAPSKLQMAGLENNPDWEGLPEFFAVWADHAGWENEKAQFAYWNPGTQSYSYFFEAIRRGGEIRFRPIPQPKFVEEEASLEGDGYFQYKDGHGAVMVAETDLKTDSPTHPFVFFHPLKLPKTGPDFEPVEQKHVSPEKPRVEIDVRPAPLDPAKPEQKDATPAGR
jgi:hypothetical protein